MLKKVISLLVFSVIFFCCINVIEAAGPPGPPMGGGGNGPPCWPPPCTVPIDGGISLLIAAGIGLAGKKIYDNRQKA